MQQKYCHNYKPGIYFTENDGKNWGDLTKNEMLKYAILSNNLELCLGQKNSPQIK